MDEGELRIEADALEFVKAQGKEIISRFAPPEICHPVDNPVSLFMAGSPGAGKTEVSKSFIKNFRDIPVRIDADEIRPLCPGYTGANAHLFQKAANKAVNILYDYVLHHKLNCILDGTFAYAGAADNIERSLRRNRRVELWFVYQDPIKAWEFTKARESREARRVSKQVFLRAISESRKNAHIVKERFGDQIELNVLVKDYEESQGDSFLDISADELDRRTKGRYSEEELENILV